MVKHIESGMSGRMMGFNSLSWIRDVAMKLEIKGAVFTRPDGSIKVVAEGEEKKHCKEHPVSFSHVLIVAPFVEDSSG